MQLSTTFRHMDASQAVREYAAEKLDKIKKYFNKDPISAHAVFAVERGFNHVADINITLPNGIVINAKEVDRGHVLLDRPRGGAHRASGAQVEGEDPRPQAARRPRRGVPRGRHPGRGARAPARPRPTAHGKAERKAAQGGKAASPGFRVVKDETFSARSMTVEDAVMQLNLLGDELIVFTDAGTQCISILYRRKDGNYGLIETGSSGRRGLNPGNSLSDTSRLNGFADRLPMKVIDFLKQDAIIADLDATTKAAALAELATHMASLNPRVDAARAAPRARGARAPRLDGHRRRHRHPARQARLDRRAGGRARRARCPGIEFESIDGKPTHLIFMLVAPVSSTGVHLKALARLSRLFRDADFRRRLLAAPTREDMYQVIADEDAKY